ncbi:hypothetical protein CRM22_007256 [Opisthorchis felineus]|uniref:NIPSNAP domain-containing protein n=1 Tax=Opisthorchis felineus TaxID=147828 RepID=A0A4S2LGW9_OPIFE|nr:hypothetical protein CRM22_007256 [Opisthorchis felineus]
MPCECSDKHKILLLYIFDNQLTKSFNNRLVSQKNVMRTYGNGKPVGYAEDMLCVEGMWRPNMTMGLLQFDSEETALRWRQSDPQFRKSDWLDDHDLWVLPLHQELETCACFELDMFKVPDPNQFENEFLPKWEEAIRKAGGTPGVSSTGTVKIWRGMHDVDYVFLSQWPTELAASEWHRSDEAMQLKNRQPPVANGCMMIARMRMFC